MWNFQFNVPFHELINPQGRIKKCRMRYPNAHNFLAWQVVELDHSTAFILSRADDLPSIRVLRSCSLAIHSSNPHRVTSINAEASTTDVSYPQIPRSAPSISLHTSSKGKPRSTHIASLMHPKHCQSRIPSTLCPCPSSHERIPEQSVP